MLYTVVMAQATEPKGNKMSIQIVHIPQRIENTRNSWRYRGFKFVKVSTTRSRLSWWVSLDGETYKLRTKADAIDFIDRHCDR